MNTAMLTGEQVMEQLRVFMVTQAGDVADVTLKSSCRSTDESVLKVGAGLGACAASTFMVVLPLRWNFLNKGLSKISCKNVFSSRR